MRAFRFCGATPTDAAIADRVRPRMNGQRLGRWVDGKRVSCARVITETVKRRGLPKRAAVIAVTTAITESALRNYTEPGDHDSLGLFQQRPSQGWGTPEQLTNPVYATNAFLEAMLRKYPNDSWKKGGIGAICQKVQVSAVPGAYAREVHDARLLVDALWTGGGKVEYRVHAYRSASVRDRPGRNGSLVGSVVPGESYPANCWTTGESVVDNGVTNDVWVRLRLRSGTTGYVSAVYLEGDERAGLPRSARCGSQKTLLHSTPEERVEVPAASR